MFTYWPITSPQTGRWISFEIEQKQSYQLEVKFEIYGFENVPFTGLLSTDDQKEVVNVTQI